MEIDLRERVVVVTGAGRGIGRTIADRFVAEGARVAALDVAFGEAAASADADANADAGAGAGAGAGPGVVEIACDVSDPASVATAVDAVVERFGVIDVLVNNAGINVDGPVSDLDWDAWRRCFDVNVGGVFLMSQAVAAVMRRQADADAADADRADSATGSGARGSGRIINAASFAAIVPSVGSAAYAASKAAVVQLTRVLAGELGPWGITVNAYAPGMVPTAMNGFATMEQAAQDRLLDTLSLRRWERADDVADLLCFLASDRASYITGALLDVSGGKLATQIPAKAYEIAARTDQG